MDNLPVASINDYPTEKFNRLFPATVTQISPLHKVMFNVVSIDTNLNAKEVYKQSGGLALTKIACLKLMTAANVVMEDSKPLLPQGCQRCIEIAQRTRLAPQCNGCPTKQDVAYQVSILVPEPSGGHRRYIATKEISRTDYKGVPEHMAAQCETKALLRALRAGLGLKGSYTEKELEKPFAVALVVLNTTDPELKTALIQRYAAGQDALFGGGVSIGHQLTGGDQLQLAEGVSTEVMVLGPDPDEDVPGATPAAQACEICGLIIEPVGDWTVEMIANKLREKFGKVICHDCQVKQGLVSPPPTTVPQAGGGQA